MAELSQARALGGVGSILLLITFLPYAGWILGIVGLILILLAVKYISDYTHERSIFTNIIWAVVLDIGGIIVGAVVVFAALFHFLGLGMFSPGYVPPSNLSAGDIIGLIVSIVLGLVAIWVFYLVSAIFLKRSFDTIAAKLNVHLFNTAALLYLIGAITAIFLIGFVIIFIAQILFVAAFFSIPEQQMQPT